MSSQLQPNPPSDSAASQSPNEAAGQSRLRPVTERLFGPGFVDTIDSVLALQKQLRNALHSTETAMREEAAVRLLRLDDGAVLRSVVKRLSSTNQRVAVGAARLLGQARIRAAVPSLMSAFRSQSEDVAESIADSLGEIGDALAVPLLCTAIDARFVSIAAVDALGRIDDPRSLGTLMRALRSSSDELRIASARSLGLVRRRSRHAHPAEQRAAAMVVPSLREALTDDVTHVRVNAALSLWTLGERNHAKVALHELKHLLAA